MPIVTSLVVALLASTALAADSPSAVTQPLPPLIVNLSTAANVSPTLLARVLEETTAIWRAAGFSFIWRPAAREVVPYARTSDAGPSLPSHLRVVIGNDTGRSSDNRTPLGWITFDDDHSPVPEIYVSYQNANRLLEAARGFVGIASQMTGVQREMLLARTMGRALAHEMGHYLLASKVHTPRGLMQASHAASDFFATGTNAFRIDAGQRRSIEARLRHESALVRE
jgi:hypothetical protein